jgi:hypothetical protein
MKISHFDTIESVGIFNGLHDSEPVLEVCGKVGDTRPKDVSEDGLAEEIIRDLPEGLGEFELLIEPE